MRRPRRNLAPGLAAVLMAAAPAMASAAPSPPNLVPFLDENDSTLGIPRWYVDTSLAGGAYSARYHHPEQVADAADAGPFHIVAGTPGGDAGSPTAVAVQQIEGGSPRNLTSVQLVGTPLGGADYQWGISNVVAYTLQPPGGGPTIAGALGPVCRGDSGQFVATPPGPPAFDSPTCSPLDRDATGFDSGISPGYQDVVALSSGNAAYFDISSVPPGDGTVTETVDPTNDIAESVETDNTASAPIGVPGVTAAAASARTTPATAVSIPLSAKVVHPEILGRRLNDARPADDPTQPAPAPATAALIYARATAAAHGTASVDASGTAHYLPATGFTGTDTFTYYAEDSRGLRSAPATVTVTVAAPAAPVGGGGSGSASGSGAGSGSGSGAGAAHFTLSAAQLLINQRIGQAAIRRLNAVQARLDGRPAPATGAGHGHGTVTLSAGQLLINQRIYQAAIRRAAALEARLAGRAAPAATHRNGGTVRLSLHQLVINQRIAQAAVRRANALVARTG